MRVSYKKRCKYMKTKFNCSVILMRVSSQYRHYYNFWLYFFLDKQDHRVRARTNRQIVFVQVWRLFATKIATSKETVKLHVVFVQVRLLICQHSWNSFRCLYVYANQKVWLCTFFFIKTFPHFSNSIAHFL